MIFVIKHTPTDLYVGGDDGDFENYEQAMHFESRQDAEDYIPALVNPDDEFTVEEIGPYDMAEALECASRLIEAVNEGDADGC